MPPITIQTDDLRGAQTIALLHAHRQDMFKHSQGAQVLGCGALKELNVQQAELKSMRTATGHLRRGVGAKILEHILQQAQDRAYAQLYLETGTVAAFAPARALYARYGFRECGPFADYVEDPYSVFMCLDV